jgi:predicted hotdog family 3-hydroxylacyl-ACP dehydratase
VPLSRDWIEQHIPHQGGMCLLDEVLTWDATRVQCRSSTHRAATNPLRAHGRLGAVCGIEYAAQAMAVHGALLASANASRVVGYLASLRNVAMYTARLDDVVTDLVVTAELVTGDERTVLYTFSVSSGGRALLEGRATIVFTTAVDKVSMGSRNSA